MDEHKRICGECRIYIANHDLTGIDDDARAAEVEAAEGWWTLIDDDVDTDAGSTWPCERCGTSAHGDRYTAVRS